MEIHCSIPFKSLSKKLDGNFLLFKIARASSTAVILPALFSFFSMLGKIASKLLHSSPAKIRLQWLGDSYTANQTWILPMPLHRLSDHMLQKPNDLSVHVELLLSTTDKVLMSHKLHCQSLASRPVFGLPGQSP